ncbi:MAG TPA: sigma-70 family RNA polymerase sigma factor [Candidatus Hydrogenedentes bacterium]|nr:sigma-70 family RNA polymerase sigma factor [Candidatus Hydrogenedentota bacterium]HIJ74848.1 sigma-70 family RNA polymerase sigma factor [Candidatus Hydrogenedentota bacterium]
MSIPLDSAVLYDAAPVDADDRGERPRLRSEADDMLVAAAKRGDGRAFEELVRRYRNEVYALAYHLVHDREDAWDISQEVFIKAHRGLKRFRGDCGFKTWLLRITSNQCKDFFKRRSLRTVPFDEAIGAEGGEGPGRNPREALENRELGEAILSALDALPAKHRTAFVLREFEGLTYDAMARVMGCRIGTVMSRLHHARRRLRNALAAMGVGEEN